MIAAVIVGVFAVSYGWGMRGTPLGHGRGAILPGILLGLFSAYIAGRLGATAVWEHRLIPMAAAGAAMYFGGNMTYGQTIGLSLDGSRRGLVKGRSALAFRGFLWFGIAGGFLALSLRLLSGGGYGLAEVIISLAMIFPLYYLGVGVFNRPHDPENGRFPKLYFSSGRPECWGGYLFILLGLWLIFAVKSDGTAVLFSLLSGFGAAIGWALGNAFHYHTKFKFKNGKFVLDRLTRRGVIGGWKCMEFSIGAFGALFTFLGVLLMFGGGKAEAVEFAPLAGEAFLTAATYVWLAWVIIWGCIETVRDIKLKGGKTTGFWAAADKFEKWPSELSLAIGPLALALLGGEKAAAIFAVFVPAWVLLPRMALVKYADFKGRTFLRALLIAGTAAALALPLAVSGIRVLTLASVAVCTVWYTVLVLIETFRPAKRVGKTLVEAYGSALTVDTYFVLTAAATMLWAALII